MGGLGKTTLAKMVYHHEQVRSHFDRFAWACISQQWQARDVWEGILTRLTSPSMNERQRISKLRDDELAKELYELQIMMKCLIVLDDIWSEDAWDSLSAGFPQAQAGNCLMGSKILLTSRNVKVALHADPNGFLHRPRCLSEFESWELFMRTAIHGREETSKCSYLCFNNLVNHIVKIKVICLEEIFMFSRRILKIMLVLPLI